MSQDFEQFLSNKSWNLEILFTSNLTFILQRQKRFAKYFKRDKNLVFANPQHKIKVKSNMSWRIIDKRENKELVLLSQIESKMDCLTKVFYVGVSLSEDIPWGFGNIWTTLNYLFNKKITKQIDSNQFMNVWQRPKPWKIFFLSSRIVTQRLHLSYERIYCRLELFYFSKWKILAVSLNRTLFEFEEIFFEMRDKWCFMLK